jgi:ribosomal protein S27AE
MARACRDCPRCTEASLFSLVFLPFRMASWFLTFWNVGLLRRSCPSCGHNLSIHQRHQGRFAD